MIRVVCIGECMIELSAAEGGRLQRSFAGDVYNTAVYLKRQLPEAQVAFLTVTGDDPLSAAMRERWREEGLEDNLASVAPGKLPGLYLVETDATGERQFFYWRGESAARGWLAALQRSGGAELLGSSLGYLSGISLAILQPGERQAAMQLLRSIGVPLAFDPNFRARLWDSPACARATLEAMAGVAKITLPSLEDLNALWGPRQPVEHFAHLKALGASEIAITLGEQGCLLEEGLVPCAPGVRVVDTSGAGDSFNGAYMAARLAGQPPLEAAQAGLLLAARVVAHRGALVPRFSSTEML